MGNNGARGTSFLVDAEYPKAKWWRERNAPWGKKASKTVEADAEEGNFCDSAAQKLVSACSEA